MGTSTQEAEDTEGPVLAGPPDQVGPVEVVPPQQRRGPDPERHIAAIREYADAGFDHAWVHQIGPDQRGFLGFYRDEVLPKLR